MINTIKKFENKKRQESFSKMSIFENRNSNLIICACLKY